MFEAGAIVTGLATLVWNTVSETAKAEGGGIFAGWLKKDIGAALEQQLYNASNAYLKNYQERHGKFKVACVRMDSPIELDKLYTAVRVLQRAELAYFESTEGLQDHYRESGRRSFRGKEGGKQDGIIVANQEQFLLVLGGPGTGKSTLLRKVGLESLKRRSGTYFHDCIPVFLPLQRFKDVSIPIEQRIAKEFETCGFPEPAAVTAAMLKKGKLLVLLDGLDEVPKDAEDAVVEQIRDFVDIYSDNRFIASCRVAAYKGGFLRFKDVAIAPFEDQQIKEFIDNWFASEKDLENDTAGKCWELMIRPEYAATKELAQTPLLLTLLCAVYNKQQAFAKNRASLYGEALDVVLKEWAAEKRIHNNPIYLDLPLELERELLSELAFDSFVDDQLFFDKQDVTRRIRTFLVGNLNAPKHLDSEAVLEAIEVQQGILVERARDAYSFSHLTFQEYLTAQHIVDNRDIEWLVEEHIADRRWQEVFLLVTGLLRGGTGANPLLQKMETKAAGFLGKPKLDILIRWAESSTANSGNSVAKRAGVIAIAIAIAKAIAIKADRARAIDSVSTSAITKAITIASAIDNVRAITIASASAITIASASVIARKIQDIQLFEYFPCDKLIDSLDKLKNQENNKAMSKPQIIDALLGLWSDALQLDLDELANLDIDEYTALANYLYSCHLIIQCKDEAVRVSPQVWQGIEDRLLTVPKDVQS